MLCCKRRKNIRALRWPEKTLQEMGEVMGNKEQTVLLVSNDAGFCAAMRREFDSSALRVRAAAVSSVAAARRILEEDSPGVILLEEDAVAGDGVETREAGQTLDAVVAPLAV